MYDILKHYVQRLPSVNSEDVVGLPPSLIENSWRDIVRNASDLPKETQSQQEVIWELLSTEITYIESLQVITTRFRSCLQAVQKELPGVMKEIDIEMLFSNIVEVFAANSKFWKEYLCESLKVSRQTHEPINPSLLKDGFTKFPELMKPYQRFCADQMLCQNYIKTQYSSNEYFKNFVAWAESNTNLCKRLRLIDIIITPMQRLTRYSLLLRRIKEKSVEEKQKEDLEIMIQTVEKFVSDVNLIVGEKRESDKLNEIASRIDSYEGCEAPNEECVKLLNNYNQKFKLTSQMPNCLAKQSRYLLHHCSMKFKDSTVRQDVECYLFTDLLLICKLKKFNDRLKVLKPPIRVDQISLEELKDKGSILVIQTNDYIVPIMAFILHADSASIKNFIAHIYKAKDLYNEANQHSVQNQPYQITGNIKSTLQLQYRSSFQEGKYDKFTDPSPSPKFHEKSRPNSFSFTKHKLQNSTHEQTMASPRIVCESPSPETQTSPSLQLPTSEMKTSHSMPSCASSEWLSQTAGEETKSKSERKRKTEKRYNTADSIQELKRKEHADNSIHKRFSWNSGSTHKENRQNLYKHVSSDSIRSSSGVSSTCSSHLSPDHENNENDEETTPVNVPAEPLLTEPNENFLTLNTENKTLSKSMPDIAVLLHDVSPSEMKDGISSVDITGLDVKYEGLNHMQVLNIKKYLLLNSSNESEV
ncbi:pleckstrin homology domain-containing family G member 5 isoform X11 [Octopus vulgaris]|nr:pleckstrin homology domain-containing family G member 5 isoform X11 [Octopus vulgaris]